MLSKDNIKQIPVFIHFFFRQINNKLQNAMSKQKFESCNNGACLMKWEEKSRQNALSPALDAST